MQVTFTDGFISEIAGRTAMVADKAVGKVTDFIVTRPDDTFPHIDGFIIKTRNGQRFAPMATIIDVDHDGRVVLSATPHAPAFPEEETLYLVEDLLDKQIVDVDGRKVVRINDIEVAHTGESMRVVAADIGLSGLIRRLGFKSIAKRFTPGLVGRIPRNLIAWDNVAPIGDANPGEIHLSVSEHRLARLHPSDLAEIIGELSAQDAARVIHQLDDETAADALEHLDAHTQRSIIEDIGTERAADIIEEMDSDDAADLLNELPEDHQSQLLAEMEPETAGELRELVEYAENTAGGLMTTDYVWIYPHRTVEATIVKLRVIAPETEFIYYLYVLDNDEKLLGVLSLRALLLADPQSTIHAIMETDLVSVHPDTNAQDVASTIARYDLMACPVLGDDGKMLGIVTVDDAIDAIIPERLARKLPRFNARHHRADAAAQ